MRHQHLESLVARQIAQNARIVRIVFDDQQNRVALLQVVAIVFDPALPVRPPSTFDKERGNRRLRAALLLGLATLGTAGPT